LAENLLGSGSVSGTENRIRTFSKVGSGSGQKSSGFATLQKSKMSQLETNNNYIHDQVKASNNYLALRNMSGHYYLNGNWRIDFPQQIEMAGKLI
jgi:ADAM-TS Spacer 1